VSSFASGGKNIRIDHYAPGVGTRPTILILHGSGGPLRGIDPFAQQAAGFGVHVFVVHYFERTGHNWVSPNQIQANFLDWLQTLQDAISYVAEQPGVDRQRIGLIGFSLGAYLALALATRDSRIIAVAEFFGGLAEPFSADAAKLPPVLVLHGDQDPVVPLEEARKLERLLAQNNIPHELKIYPGQGHHFTGLAQMDALGRVVSFFRQYLTKAA
jgi:dienelactone hydrolase